MNGLITALITSVSALVGVFVANYLSSIRATEDKVWDLRRQAYGVIISELSSIESVLNNAKEMIDEDEQRYFMGEGYDRHNKIIGRHNSKLHQRFADDYLILSDEFIAEFEKFSEATEVSDPNDGIVEVRDQFDTAVREYRPRLLKIARAETTAQLTKAKNPLRRI